MRRNKRFIVLILCSMIALFFLQAAVTPYTPGAVAVAASEWQPNTSYTAGTLVTYQGKTYKCLQSHTSLVGWEPSTTPALWEVQAGGTTPTPTTQPPTTVPPTTVPPTTVPPTTPPTGSCSAQPYVPGQVYTGGQQVSYNGRNWQAKWWTQNEAPSTGGSGVWTDLGPCSGGTPTPTTVPPTTVPPTTVPPTTVPPTTVPPTTVPPTTVPPGGGGKQVIAYFAQWGVYGRSYFVKNIVSSGAASKITTINYAFANVANNSCVIGDSYADYDMAYSAANSVDGVADTWDTGALRGSFGQLKKLKKLYPNIKVVISLGGWTWSGGFSSAAKPANVGSFVKSCVDLFIKDSRWAGVFDGIDIDWEYPAACGLQCGVPEDTANYTNMLAEFRRQLDAVRPGLLLTIAAPAGPDKYSKIEMNKIHPYLNWINLMTYDMHGTWETTTNHQAPLYENPADPTKALGYNINRAVTDWIAGGTPASKLVLGIPFYGRGWKGVPSTNNGLYQTSSGAAPGTYEAGNEDYKVLKTLENGSNVYWDSVAQASYLYVASTGTFWTYDTPNSIANKTNYIKSKGLGGGMFWELSGDDASGTLITALYNGLR